MFRELRGGRHVGAGKDDEKLLAAHPICEVVRAQRLAEPVGDLDQHGIAHSVPVFVVDALEVVDVAGDHGHRLAGDLGLCGQLVQPLVERPAVEHARETVDHGFGAVIDI